MVVGALDNEPGAFFIEYKTLNSDEIKVEVSWGATKCSVIPTGESFWRVFSTVNFVNSLNLQETEIAANAVDFAKEIVEEGIKLRSEAVGPPIRILKITGKEAK